jgi:predicted AlkP superfamily phosphohydrolase/phosphomutase
MKPKQKILIIGIDSATFDIINPLVRNGNLPNLSLLTESGTSGQLRSTIPPVTPPAWVSFMTGKNPGKHGVFDFYVSPSYGYIRPVWNSKYIKTKTIWRMLSDNGLKVGVVNLPMTHPPEKINGFIIPGMQYSLDEGINFSYPPEIMQEIHERFGEYRVLYGDLESLYTNNMDNLLEEWRKIFEIRKQSILYLMEHKEWDVFMAVFYSIDVMQHHFWKFFDKTHPQYDARMSQKYENIIPEFYGKIDEAVGEMLKKIDDNTMVIVMSDHGAGPEKGAFYLNNWLYKMGFIFFREIFSPLWRIKFPHIFYKALKRLGFPGIAWTVPLNKLKTLGKFVDPREGLSVPFFIDWKKTKAYAGNHTEQGIYINVKGREPSGIVEKGSDYETVRESVLKKIKEVKDPETGGPLEIDCFKKEEIYHGPYIDDAPDLFVIMKEGEYVMQKELYHKGFFGLPNKSSGTHRTEGILIISGNNIKAKFTIKIARIIDIAPTIFYSLGIPVPEDMDGRVLCEAFTKEYIKRNPVMYGNAVEIKVKRGDGILNEEESAEIKKSLRNLGYF